MVDIRLCELRDTPSSCSVVLGSIRLEPHGEPRTVAASVFLPH